MRPLSLRARLVLGVLVARGGRARARRRRHLHLAALVPVRPRRQARSTQSAARCRSAGSGRDRGAAGPASPSSWRSAGTARTVIATAPGARSFAGRAERPDPQLPDDDRRRRTGGDAARARALLHGAGAGRRRPLPRPGLARASAPRRCSSSRRRSTTSTPRCDRLLADRAARDRSPCSRRSSLLGLWVVRLGLRPLDAIGRPPPRSPAATSRAASSAPRRAPRSAGSGSRSTRCSAQIESSFQAQEASERKLRRFVADASHELRTPLAAVRAYAELFAAAPTERPDDLARSMRGISRESERMSLLVDDLLLLARLDEGRPLEREPVELDEVVGEAVETAQARRARPADRRSPRSTVDRPRRPRPPAPDRRQPARERARAHAARDARVASRVGPRTATRSSRSRTAARGSRRGQLERVFERFYRADPSRARASGGVGLGLSIVAAVAEAHGGRVAARSAPASGAVFTVVVPLAPGARSQETHGVSPATPATLGAETETEEVA